MPEETILPTHILSTANNSHIPNIFSISLVDHVTYIDTACCYPWDLQDCDTMIYENVYQILSDGSLDDDTLFRMVDGSAEESLPFIHRQVWPNVARPSAGAQQSIHTHKIDTCMYYIGGADDLSHRWS